ncbi:MAG: hypothetical protein NXI32_06495 [bacterium]|nr:hypothetical protein [bacterium]
MKQRQNPNQDAHRGAVRWFVIAFVGVMILDVLPWGILPSDRPKELLCAVTNRGGLWQSQWTMFTPRPSVNHYWLTADVFDASGQALESWSSPYWPSASLSEKFLKFRYMNYYNRLCLPKNQIATRDFAEYLSRTLGTQDGQQNPQPVHVELQLNNVQMVPPSDGSLPAAEEINWVVQSKWLETINPFQEAPADDVTSTNIWTLP